MITPIEVGDTVWLVARTMCAPAICYQGPRAKVTDVDGVHVVALVNGVAHRVHEDNVRRYDPSRSVRGSRVPRQRVMADGYEEVTLW